MGVSGLLKKSIVAQKLYPAHETPMLKILSRRITSLIKAL